MDGRNVYHFKKTKDLDVGIGHRRNTSYSHSCPEQRNGGQPPSAVSILDSTKDQDGLAGSVRRVRVQSSKVQLKSGQLLEGPLQLLEITTYGLNGNRIDNESYPVAYSSVGREEYKYNDRGNIVEMTLRGNDGSILSREKYDYEFDGLGNWKKMVTSLVLFEDGELRHEPVEVTYREIAYYYDDSVAKIVAPVSARIILPTASPGFSGLAGPVNPGLKTYKALTDRRLIIDVGDEPPEVPELRKYDREALTPSNAESEEVPASKTGSATVSLTRVKGTSAAVTMSTVADPNEAANKVPPVSKVARAHYEKGREHFDLGALKEAVDSFQRSLELEPRHADVYLSLGLAYFRMKNNQEAGKAFKQATNINPEMAEAHYGLGLHYFGGGRYKNAADSFKRATLLRPDMGKAHYGLALAYQELGKPDAVIAQLRILETLDSSLAKKLSDTVPQFNLPCRVAPFCK